MQLNLWRCRTRSSILERNLPCCERLAEDAEVNASEFCRICSQVADRARQQGARANQVASRVMIESDRYLNQALKELLLRDRCFPPHIFEHFVRFEEFRAVE